MSKRRFFILAGIGLLIAAVVMFVVMVNNLLAPPFTGALIGPLLVNGRPMMYRVVFS
ncbi:MAG TPA: hypothetical protein VKY59_00800 [Spirillospora sp.]|nr:hypothetical protein [Spirillospora sp.]